jgi:cytochrome c oxidase assembly factor CtaG
MPLSEHEQRMLDEIERALYEDDPKFATSVNVSRIRRRRPIVAGCLFVAGLVALVVGVIATQSFLAIGVIVSVIGFLTMVGAVGLFVFGQPSARAAKGVEKSASKPNPSLGNRMEERFRRRFDEPNQ